MIFAECRDPRWTFLNFFENTGGESFHYQACPSLTKFFAKELSLKLQQPLVTLASSFINSNLVRTRIVGSLLQSYCKCCRGRTAVPSCNHHHHHYQHSHYHYYLHKYYHCHYPNNGLHVVIIRVFNNEDFTLTTASTVSIFWGLRCPEILPDGLCFI